MTFRMFALMALLTTTIHTTFADDVAQAIVAPEADEAGTRQLPQGAGPKGGPGFAAFDRPPVAADGPPVDVYGPPVALDNFSQRKQRLSDLAIARFGNLGPNDQKLFAEVASDRGAFFSTTDPSDDDPASAVSWGQDRSIQADRVAWLCTDPDAVKCLTLKGVQIYGARIEGHLNLAQAVIPCRLSLRKCAISSGVSLHNARTQEVDLLGCHVGGIQAPGLKVNGSFFLNGGFAQMPRYR